MRSYSLKKKICLIFIIIIVALISSGVFMSSYTRLEIVSGIEIINPEGTRGRVFVVYRPGISSFQKDMTYAFIEGLTSNGWIIDVTTASSQTPTDLKKYDLLVLGSPTYGGQPHQSILNYTERVGNLKGKKTVILITAGANGDGALAITKSSVKDANGVVIKSLILYILADNGGNARDISFYAGKSIF